jgi:hypothetical protein
MKKPSSMLGFFMFGMLVPETGIEPATFALRVRCSTD